MAPAASAFAEALANLTIAAPQGARVWSNESAEPYALSAEAVRAGLVRQLVSPVRFASSVEALYADGGRVFVEMGPGKVLRDLVARTLGSRPHLALQLDPGLADPALHLADVLAQLAIHGLELDVPRLSSDELVVRSPRSERAVSAQEAYLAANQSAMEAFFAQQRALLERLPAPSDELVRAIMDTNRSVLGEFLAAQERALGLTPVREPEAPAAAPMPAEASAPADDQAARILGWLRRAIAELSGFALEDVRHKCEI